MGPAVAAPARPGARPRVRDTPCTMSEQPRSPDLAQQARRFAEAFNSGNFDGAMSRYSPNAVWDATGMGLAIYEGREAIREYLGEWFGFFQEPHLSFEEIADLGHGIVFTTCLLTGGMKGSSGRLQVRYATVTEWSDGLATRVAAYHDSDDARTLAERLAASRA